MLKAWLVNTSNPFPPFSLTLLLNLVICTFQDCTLSKRNNSWKIHNCIDLSDLIWLEMSIMQVRPSENSTVFLHSIHFLHINCHTNPLVSELMNPSILYIMVDSLSIPNGKPFPAMRTSFSRFLFKHIITGNFLFLVCHLGKFVHFSPVYAIQRNAFISWPHSCVISTWSFIENLIFRPT